MAEPLTCWKTAPQRFTESSIHCVVQQFPGSVKWGERSHVPFRIPIAYDLLWQTYVVLEANGDLSLDLVEYIQGECGWQEQTRLFPELMHANAELNNIKSHYLTIHGSAGAIRRLIIPVQEAFGFGCDPIPVIALRTTLALTMKLRAHPDPLPPCITKAYVIQELVCSSEKERKMLVDRPLVYAARTLEELCRYDIFRGATTYRTPVRSNKVIRELFLVVRRVGAGIDFTGPEPNGAGFSEMSITINKKERVPRMPWDYYTAVQSNNHRTGAVTQVASYSFCKDPAAPIPHGGLDCMKIDNNAINLELVFSRPLEADYTLIVFMAHNAELHVSNGVVMKRRM